MIKSFSSQFFDDNGETEDGKLNDNANAILSLIMYSSCSVAMVLTNKAISSGFEPEVRARLPQISVIAFQCLIAVILVYGAKLYKIVDYPDFETETAKKWMPLNALFIGMLVTGFLALVHNNVPMVTVCKNLTNMVTITGEFYFFGETVGKLTVVSTLIMLLGAVMAGFNDLGFSLVGYYWMAANCLCTSSYVLYMRFLSTSVKLPKFGMVYYNNLLSLFLLIPFIFYFGELEALVDPEIMTPSFIIYNIAAGCLGFYLNFASLWAVSATSATTYAIVGSLNKIPITVLGFLIFPDTEMTQEGIMFIIMATMGGLLYGYSKLPKSVQKPVLPTTGSPHGSEANALRNRATSSSIQKS